MAGTAVDSENQAQICRITCGWKKVELPLDAVRRYWRDVHSPAIARRPGIWEYRHYQYNPVSTLFPPFDGLVQDCLATEQLMWLSDVRYRDDKALAEFTAEPTEVVRKQLLGDIDLIVDQSTTYKAIGDMALTLVDRSALIPPQGPPPTPTYGIFIRMRDADLTRFRTAIWAIARRWATTAGVVRLRLSLLDAPDPAAERGAGYPIKTHRPELQYQAWFDLAVEDEGVFGSLPMIDLADVANVIHSYPVVANYTSNYAGKPTFVGLRGYPAWDALTAIGGYNQAESEIMQWMFGSIAKNVSLKPVAR